MASYEARKQLDTVRNPVLYELIRITTDDGLPVASLAKEAAAEGITVRQLYRVRSRAEKLIRKSGREIPPNPRRAREVAERAARDYWQAMELQRTLERPR